MLSAILILLLGAPSNEFTPQISFLNGDVLRSSTLGAFSYTYHFNESFWLGADFQGGKLKVDSANGANIKNGRRFLALDSTFSWNIPSILGASLPDRTNGGFAADLYTAIGGGVLWIDKHQRPFGILGGGLLFHFKNPHYGIRFDLKGYFYTLKNTQGSDFNADSVLSIGPSFLF